VQIGGGVRVSDALQAIVGFEPIAIWVREICVEISQVVLFAICKLEEYETVDDPAVEESEASEQTLSAGGTSGVAGRFFGFRYRQSD